MDRFMMEMGDGQVHTRRTIPCLKGFIPGLRGPILGPSQGAILGRVPAVMSQEDTRHK